MKILSHILIQVLIYWFFSDKFDLGLNALWINALVILSYIGGFFDACWLITKEGFTLPEKK